MTRTGPWHSGLVWRLAAGATVACCLVLRAASPAGPPPRAAGPLPPGIPSAERAVSQHRGRAGWDSRSVSVVPRQSGRAQRGAAFAKPDGVDLDATYISFRPLYHQYCVDYSVDGLPRPCAGTEGLKRWPDRGEIVTFTAHFMNKGTVASGPFEFSWSIDGAQVARGSSPGLAAGAEGTALYRWPWDHDVVDGRLIGSHTVAFTLDPDNMVEETYESNNTIVDRTDASPLGFQMPPDVYAALEVPTDPKWPFSAEDWVQKQLAAMNSAFAISIYPSAPKGCAERVRLDQFLVTPDPVSNQGDIGGWFYAVDDRIPAGYYDSKNDVSGGLLHELAHQLGIIDLYTMDVNVSDPIHVLDRNGRPVQLGFSSGYRPGLMNNAGIRPPKFDEYTAGAMNRNKGYRRGYYGEYEYDIPPDLSIRVLDAASHPAAGVLLRFHKRHRGVPEGADDNAPVFTAQTGADGVAPLPRLPVGARVTTLTGHTLSDNPFGDFPLGGDSMAYIVVIEKGSHEEFGWFDITEVNLLQWRGEGLLELKTHIPPDDAPAPPTSLAGLTERGKVVLRWTPGAGEGAATYNIYKTQGQRETLTRLAAGVAGNEFVAVLNGQSAGFAVTAVDAKGRESGFSDSFWGWDLRDPGAVAIAADGRRFVVESLGVVQFDADGRYWDFSRPLASASGRATVDADGRLVVCEPDTDMVAVIDPTAAPSAAPVLEFGGSGTDPGQFNHPTGVASQGGRFEWGGPYRTDSRTLLLSHFDGTFATDGGVNGTPNGALLVSGRYGQGVSVQGAATLAYRIGTVPAPPEGAVEFWLRPSWHGNDRQDHFLLETGQLWGDGMLIVKDEASALRLLAWKGGVESGAAAWVGDWQPMEWHHVAVVWRGGRLTMFVDGVQRDSCTEAGLPATFGPDLVLGWAAGGDGEANAVFDELRISSYARVGSSDAGKRFIVVDSLNDRLQVLDAIGSAVATFGGPGVGPGQFQSPQGVAWDESGRVVVADSGNGRLQVLAFDGRQFTVATTISGGLVNPQGVAVSGDLIVVADAATDEVKVFDHDGSLLAAYSAPNDGVHLGRFSRPLDVAIDRRGSIVVVDSDNGRLAEIHDWAPRRVRRHTLPAR